MTTLVMERVIDEIEPSRGRTGQAVVPQPAATPPVLPDDLRRQIELLKPVRFGDFVLQPPAPTYHPDAAHCADELRRVLAPAPRAVIRFWFSRLVKLVGPGVLSPEAVFEGLMLTCADLPAPCWSDAVLAEIISTHKFLPLVAELKPMLQAAESRLRAQLRNLDSIAKADPATRFSAGPARASTASYTPPAYLPPKGPHPSMPKNDTPEDLAEAKLQSLIAAPIRTVADQIATLGGLGDIDLLAARREAHGQ